MSDCEQQPEMKEQSDDNDAYWARRCLCCGRDERLVWLTCSLIMIPIKLKSFHSVAWKQMALWCKNALSVSLNVHALWDINRLHLCEEEAAKVSELKLWIRHGSTHLLNIHWRWNCCSSLMGKKKVWGFASRGANDMFLNPETLFWVTATMGWHVVLCLLADGGRLLITAKHLLSPNKLSPKEETRNCL